MFDVNSKVGSGAVPAATGMTPPLQPTNPAYNTYVGARYVPVFSEQPGALWTPDVAYEPLTIVLHEGNSYTSKTFVPVGVQITDQEYWALTGNYNAQVEMYRQEVANLSATVNNITMGSLSKQREIIILGDSWSIGFPGGDNTKGWIYFLKQHNKGDFVGYYAGRNGCGFATGANNWSSLLDTVSVPDSSKITHIYVIGGTNDTNSTQSDVNTGMRNFISHAKTLYPNAVIKSIYVSTQHNNDITRNYLVAGYNAELDVYDGMKYCNFIGDSIWTRSSHPTDTFNAFLALHFYYIIQNGTGQLTHPNHTYVLHAPEGVTLSGATINVSIIDDVKFININGVYPSGSFAPNTYYDVAYANITGSDGILPVTIKYNITQLVQGGYAIIENEKIPCNVFINYNNTGSNNNKINIQMSWAPVVHETREAKQIVCSNFSYQFSASTM